MCVQITAISAALAAAIAAASAAGGQVTDPDATVLDDLIVRSSVPGPPWWKAQHQGRTVYIFAEPATLPRSQPWDRTALNRRLAMADLVILPPVLKGTTDRGEGEPALNEVIPEPLRARLDAAAQSLGKSPARYAGQSVIGAAKRLTDDFWSAARLDDDMSPGFLNGWRGKGSVTTSIGEFDARREAATLPAQLACLEGVLAAVEAGRPAFEQGAAAWASGDVRAALAAPAGDRWWRCAQPYAAVVSARVRAIESALNDPAVKVAITTSPLHSMVIENGVVDQLRDLGYEVIDPARMGGD